MSLPVEPPAAERLDYAERWLRDGLAVLRPALSVCQVTVDMTGPLAELERLRKSGVAASPTHLLVHAAARVLAGDPQLHQMIAGNVRHRPASVDIGLSVTGETFVSPVLIIEEAETKSVEEIAVETARRAGEARDSDAEFRQMLKKWGWVIPWGWMRRGVLRALNTQPAFRRRAGGTFQISMVPTDWGLTSVFPTGGVLMGGQTIPRVVACNGQPVVRPTMALTLSCDHGVWDGRAAAKFLAGVRTKLESMGADRKQLRTSA